MNHRAEKEGGQGIAGYIVEAVRLCLQNLALTSDHTAADIVDEKGLGLASRRLLRKALGFADIVRTLCFASDINLEQSIKKLRW